jgi:membrane-bound lytic murein transglycosylase D
LRLAVVIILIFGLSRIEAKIDGENISDQIVPQILSLSPVEHRPWRAPEFESQENALGYSTQTGFGIPKGMESQVAFWVDVYSKYTSQQGIIHDSENVSKIYAVVDLSDLKSDRLRQKRMDKKKKEIAAGLSDREKIRRLRFQLGQRDYILRGIYQSGRYLEEMEKIFRDAGLPIELTRLAFVESSFNIMARSKVGASGIWQIMPSTARPHRMISPIVDKRNHPLEATRFAAKLLRDNYRMLDSWPLAVTGYNHGPSGVKKMTRKYQTQDLGELTRNVKSRRSFGFASRNFYASFLAALEVEKNADKYFGDQAVWSRPLAAQDISLPVSVQYKEILNWFEGDDRRVQMFNPHLTSLARKGRAPIPAKTVISIPKDRYNFALVSLARKSRTVAMENPKN